MRAVVLHDGALSVAEIPTPEPANGHVLLTVSRAGICGSDVHLRANSEDSARSAAVVGHAMNGDRHGVVLGHEFVGEVADFGPGTRRRWKPGTPVVALPVLRSGDAAYPIGTSGMAPGAFAEQMLVQESLAFRVPNGLPAELAALTEPIAVGWHAVRRSRIAKGDTAIVIGCGPVGLAVIASLKAVGVRMVIASDLSPRRRELAAVAGADVVVDPQVDEPFDQAKARSNARMGLMDRIRVIPKAPPWLTTDADTLGVGFGTIEALRRVPLPWWYVFRAMHRLHKGPVGAVVYECAGVPGLIDQIIEKGPMMTRLVVAGACSGPDSFRPKLGIYKEPEILFASGYDAGEFRDVLHMIANGTIDVAPFVTGTVGLDGVSEAFDQLDRPEGHAKILIDPRVMASASVASGA